MRSPANNLAHYVAPRFFKYFLFKLKFNLSLQCLRGQLADTEQANAQRLIDLANRHRQESELEIERLRTAQLQAERTLEARERAHKQRVKGLEEQVQF